MAAWAATLVHQAHCSFNISSPESIYDKNFIPITELLMETEKKKKGFIATIWESMSKTGGCCGGGGNCGCGPSDEDDKKTAKKDIEEESGK
jgi:hypothetical protein